MNLKRWRYDTIFYLISASITTSNKYLVFYIEASLSNHEDWHWFDFDGFCDSHQWFIDYNHLVILSSYNWQALCSLVFETLVYLCKASNKVSMTKSSTPSNIRLLEEAHLLIDELILLLLVLKGQYSCWHVAQTTLVLFSDVEELLQELRHCLDVVLLTRFCGILVGIWTRCKL